MAAIWFQNIQIAENTEIQIKDRSNSEINWMNRKANVLPIETPIILSITNESNSAITIFADVNNMANCLRITILFFGTSWTFRYKSTLLPFVEEKRTIECIDTWTSSNNNGTPMKITECLTIERFESPPIIKKGKHSVPINEIIIIINEILFFRTISKKYLIKVFLLAFRKFNLKLNLNFNLIIFYIAFVGILLEGVN